jgi:formylglycine-generating enzyme required for sulfatase activity
VSLAFWKNGRCHERTKPNGSALVIAVWTRALLTLLALLTLALACGCMRMGFRDSDEGDSWVTVAAGTFMQGSAKSTPCRHDNQDLHPVTLTRSFEIQTTEVTQAQFEAVMGSNPAHFTSCGAACPVEMVTWDDAAAYCNALSALRGYEACYHCAESGVHWSCSQTSGATIYACKGYRLPTGAEWELAYRAGTKTLFYSGGLGGSTCGGCKTKVPNADKIGWYCANAGGTTHPAAQKQANAWGLYDMAGNVWEWCHEGYQDRLGTSAVTDPKGPSSTKIRLARGGSWINTVSALYAAQRYALSESYFNNGVGFRCVRTITP